MNDTSPIRSDRDQEWRSKLTRLQYDVTRRGATERAFSHPLYTEHRDGEYHCVCCEHPLFTSEMKYESGSGWPSFHWNTPAQASFDSRTPVTECAALRFVVVVAARILAMSSRTDPVHMVASGIASMVPA